jgi:hypothetical protein
LRRNDVGQLGELERRITLGANAARHARSIGRDVADTRLRSPELAAATRHLADALDRALRGQEPAEALTRAEQELSAPPTDHDQAMLAAQLRQLLADLRPG